MPDWTSLLPSAPSTPSAPVMPQYNFLTAADVLNAQRTPSLAPSEGEREGTDISELCGSATAARP